MSGVCEQGAAGQCKAGRWWMGWFWFDFCFTALQHILDHFGRGQLT